MSDIPQAPNGDSGPQAKVEGRFVAVPAEVQFVKTDTGGLLMIVRTGSTLMTTFWGKDDGLAMLARGLKCLTGLELPTGQDTATILRLPGQP